MMVNTDGANHMGKITKPLRRVISVCEIKDIATWRIASRKITRHIDAGEYLLICPDSQLVEFQAATGPGWKIQGESGFSGNCPPDKIRQMVTGMNLGRVNWLFQQFLKINAMVASELSDDEAVLIWDADTIPLRGIDFVDRDSGKLCCFHGREHHRPYFETVEKLFGFGKVSEESFIAQCLPVRVGWVREMVGEIEAHFQVPYVDAVLRLLPGVSGSEFSEYETLGAWMLAHHRDEMVFRKKNRWLRSGSTIVGPDLSGMWARAKLRVLGLRYEFVAVESWKRPIGPAVIVRSLWRRVGGGR